MVQLRAALRRLEELYISDPLTGLFNRRGFEQQASAVFSQCKANNIPLMLIAIDMDDLKYINDTYGHIQGDNAIQLLGKALSYSSMGKEICARVGGDEFNVIAGDYSQDELDDFMSSVLNYIESYNEISDVPYNINASYGVKIGRAHV